MNSVIGVRKPQQEIMVSIAEAEAEAEAEAVAVTITITVTADQQMIILRRYRTQQTLNAGKSAFWSIIGPHSSYWRKNHRIRASF
ncbi:hypothetical protein [Paenibacillus odorifer]|uniref:hypothetical protein n=1 Tax=Paenibacillus odorifer TaxID=189426 RepID=UPI000DAEDDFD|nr:hypothetical protein [Paenibacillus odorifer]